MSDPYYSQYPNYTIKSISPQIIKKPNLYSNLTLYENLVKKPSTRQPYLPVSNDSLDMILNDTQPHSQDILDIITEDKLKLLGATSQLFKHLIDHRSKIKDDNIAGLDHTILQCSGYLLNMEDFWPACGNSLAEVKRANLSNTITRLESEKNQEITKCWNDQSRLYIELLQTLGEFKAAMRRSQILSDEYQPHL